MQEEEDTNNRTSFNRTHEVGNVELNDPYIQNKECENGIDQQQEGMMNEDVVVNDEIRHAPGVRIQMSRLVGGEYQMRLKVPHKLVPLVSKYVPLYPYIYLIFIVLFFY